MKNCDIAILTGETMILTGNKIKTFLCSYKCITTVYYIGANKNVKNITNKKLLGTTTMCCAAFEMSSEFGQQLK